VLSKRKNMKALIGTLLSLFIVMQTQAQITNYAVGDTSPDFSLVDTDGNPISLYALTGAGQYVLVNFFTTTCSACEVTAPVVSDFYVKYGCNASNVFVLSVDDIHTDAQVDAFVAANAGALPPPSVSGAQGGSALVADYGMGSYPTLALIDSNNVFVNIGIWPIGDVTDIENAFQDSSLVEAPCLLSVAEVEAAQQPKVFPNPSTGRVNISHPILAQENVLIQVIDISGRVVFQQRSAATTSAVQLQLEGVAPGHYSLRLEGVAVAVPLIVVQ